MIWLSLFQHFEAEVLALHHPQQLDILCASHRDKQFLQVVMDLSQVILTGGGGDIGGPVHPMQNTVLSGELQQAGWLEPFCSWVSWRELARAIKRIVNMIVFFISKKNI